MRNISETKIRHLIRQKDYKSKKKLAKLLNISKVHLYRILRRLDKEDIPSLFNKKQGRKPKEISKEEKLLVKRFYIKYKYGALNLEKIILRETKIKVPHNRIHKILTLEGLTMELKKKRKNYNWIRYERSKPNSLWHTDWCEIEYQGSKMKLIAFIDDYSRFITGYGLFNEATTENSISVLRDAIALYGTPDQLMTDHGSQFYCNEQEGKVRGKTLFQKFLEKEGIEHIRSRVKRPQSNGKIERFFGTLKQKMDGDFDDIHEFITWYNYVRGHMSLDLWPPATRFLKKSKNKVKSSE